MTRADVLKAYDVKDGVIRSPGKFEGEAVFAPAFWDQALNGEVSDGYENENEYAVSVFHLDEDDRSKWPELGSATELRIWEDDQGFVYCETNEP